MIKNSNGYNLYFPMFLKCFYDESRDSVTRREVRPMFWKRGQHQEDDPPQRSPGALGPGDPGSQCGHGGRAEKPWVMTKRRSGSGLISETPPAPPSAGIERNDGLSSGI